MDAHEFRRSVCETPSTARAAFPNVRHARTKAVAEADRRLFANAVVLVDDAADLDERAEVVGRVLCRVRVRLGDACRQHV